MVRGARDVAKRRLAERSVAEIKISSMELRSFGRLSYHKKQSQAESRDRGSCMNCAEKREKWHGLEVEEKLACLKGRIGVRLAAMCSLTASSTAR